MNFDFNNFMEAAPYILLIYLFLKDKKLFVTPTEMADLRRKILEEVSQNFLSLLVFKQFEKNMDDKFNNVEQRLDDGSRRFDKVDTSLAHIIDLMTEKHQ
nr:MAG TPA: hypothetical protein [Caudoviricetes sp.]